MDAGPALTDPEAPESPPPVRARRGRVIIAAGLVVLAAVAVFVLAYFQPQKLFIDDRVDEPFPVAAPPTSTAGAPITAPGPVAERSGSFVSLEHGTAGTATIYRLADNQRILRIEGLDTSNGPALFVYLSANPAAGPEAAFDDAYVDLGGLKGNIGDQNYEIPAEVDPAAHASVVIWCDRFDVAFGAADLV